MRGLMFLLDPNSRLQVAQGKSHFAESKVQIRGANLETDIYVHINII